MSVSGKRVRLPPERPWLVLVGIMGAGKSAVGRELARRLGLQLVDSDAEIERAAGMTIPEIFARDGEAFFRDREAQVLRRLLAGPGGVLSTGGGAFLSPRNRSVIARRGVSVWLDPPLDVVWERVSRKDTRPLLRTPDPRGTLARLMEERRPAYAEADLRVEPQAGWSVADTAEAVLAALRHAGLDDDH